MTIHLLDLPPELHLIIGSLCLRHGQVDPKRRLFGNPSPAEEYPDLPSLSALSRTCRRLHSTLSDALIRTCIRHEALGRLKVLYAVEYGHVRLLEKLAQPAYGRGVPVDFALPHVGCTHVGQQPATLLHLAALVGSSAIVAKLLSILGDTASLQVYKTASIQSNIGATVLDVAVEYSHFHIVKLVAPIKPHQSTPEANRQTYLSSALRAGAIVHPLRTEMLDHLIQLGANPDLSQALLSPVIRGLADSVQYLLKVGADPNSRSNETYLYLAVAYRRVAVVELLLAAGADVHCPFPMPNGPSVSPLHWCTQSLVQGRTIIPLNILRLLLQFGASLTEKRRPTLLYHLCRGIAFSSASTRRNLLAYLKVVLEFDEALPLITQPNSVAVTPLGLAMKHDLVDVLVMFQPHIRPELQAAVASFLTDKLPTSTSVALALPKCLEDGDQPSAATNCDSLATAIIQRKVEIVRELLEATPDALARTQPLYLAVSHHHTEIVELLLTSGAATGLFPLHSGPGLPPLHWCIQNLSQGQRRVVPVDIFRVLLRFGADIAFEDDTGHNALHRICLAMAYSSLAITHRTAVAYMQALLEFGAAPMISQAHRHGATPLGVAMKYGLVQIVQLFEPYVREDLRPVVAEYLGRQVEE